MLFTPDILLFRLKMSSEITTLLYIRRSIAFPSKYQITAGDLYLQNTCWHILMHKEHSLIVCPNLYTARRGIIPAFPRELLLFKTCCLFSVYMY